MKSSKTPIRQLRMGCGELLLTRLAPVLRNRGLASGLRAVRSRLRPVARGKR